MKRISVITFVIITTMFCFSAHSQRWHVANQVKSYYLNRLKEAASLNNDSISTSYICDFRINGSYENLPLLYIITDNKANKTLKLTIYRLGYKDDYDDSEGLKMYIRNFDLLYTFTQYYNTVTGGMVFLQFLKNGEGVMHSVERGRGDNTYIDSKGPFPTSNYGNWGEGIKPTSCDDPSTLINTFKQYK